MKLKLTSLFLIFICASAQATEPLQVRLCNWILSKKPSLQKASPLKEQQLRFQYYKKTSLNDPIGPWKAFYTYIQKLEIKLEQQTDRYLVLKKTGKHWWTNYTPNRFDVTSDPREVLFSLSPNVAIFLGISMKPEKNQKNIFWTLHV